MTEKNKECIGIIVSFTLAIILGLAFIILGQEYGFIKQGVKYMTDEEKAEEYLKYNHCNECMFWDCCYGIKINKCVEKPKYIKTHIDGLAEGRKENEQLEAQIEKMKCCGNCKHLGIFYDEELGTIHSCIYQVECHDDYNKWELADE